MIRIFPACRIHCPLVGDSLVIKWRPLRNILWSEHLSSEQWSSQYRPDWPFSDIARLCNQISQWAVCNIKFIKTWANKSSTNDSSCFRPKIWKKMPNWIKWNFGTETPILPFFVLMYLIFLPISGSSVGQLSKPRQESLIVGSQAYRKGEKSYKNLVEK